jgi:two-component system chemotaxis response regulator CheB
MGDDGARGMLALRRAGALTIAQDPETCTVGSMPRQAIALGGASLVLAPYAISEILDSQLR